MRTKNILSLSLFLSISLTAFSQTLDTTPKPMTLSRAEMLVPRPAMKPVKSLIPKAKSNIIDTLDTTNPTIKIVLMEDGTWEYRKDLQAMAKEDIFNSHWEDKSPDSYKLEWKDFPYKTYIWLADSASRYCYPGNIDNIEISSKFGIRHGRPHRGVDIRMPKGTPIYATFPGKVRMAKYYAGYGNFVIIRHENGMETFYAHLSKLEVKRDDWVEAGTEIGLAGATGRASGSHLHYEARYLGYAIDPEWMIDFSNGDLRHSVLTFKKMYLDPSYRYVPESDQEEEEIALADEADRLEAERREAELKAAKYVTVKKGDTLGAIASRNGTTVSAICKLNGISSKTILSIGRKLRVK